MMCTLNGQVAIITGASSGLGRETALALAHAGANLVLTARRTGILQALAMEIESLGGQAVYVSGDAALEEIAAEASALALGRFGSIDILINNAGQGNYSTLVDTTTEEFDNLVRTNLRSSFLFSRSVVPTMIDQGSGLIIFVSSVAGLQGVANESVYSATKFAQVGFAQSLDAELRPHGIKVTAFCPGGMKTEFALGRGRTEEAVTHSRMMDAAEAAQVLVDLCCLPPNLRIPQMTLRHMG
jgi:short-subunit dehydrogenase